jgi:uncharacterized protein HemY
MRYSDVLLMAAEAAVEAGNTSKALGYVNQVRNRAKNSTPPMSLQRVVLFIMMLRIRLPCMLYWQLII